MKLKTLGPWKKSYDKPAAVLNYSVVVWLFVIPRTVACQALLSMGILQSRILEWVAIPSPPGDLLNPGIKPRCPCWQILYHLRHQGNPRTTEWVAYPFSRASSWPRNQTRKGLLHCRQILYPLRHKPRQHIKKQRNYFADKVLFSQAMLFP